MSQYDKRDPNTLYPAPPYPKQEQSLPGAACRTTPGWSGWTASRQLP